MTSTAEEQQVRLITVENNMFQMLGCLAASDTKWRRTLPRVFSAVTLGINKPKRALGTLSGGPTVKQVSYFAMLYVCGIYDGVIEKPETLPYTEVFFPHQGCAYKPHTKEEAEYELKKLKDTILSLHWSSKMDVESEGVFKLLDSSNLDTLKDALRECDWIVRFKALPESMSYEKLNADHIEFQLNPKLLNSMLVGDSFLSALQVLKILLRMDYHPKKKNSLGYYSVLQQHGEETGTNESHKKSWRMLLKKSKAYDHIEQHDSGDSLAISAGGAVFRPVRKADKVVTNWINPKASIIHGIRKFFEFLPVEAQLVWNKSIFDPSVAIPQPTSATTSALENTLRVLENGTILEIPEDIKGLGTEILSRRRNRDVLEESNPPGTQTDSRVRRRRTNETSATPTLSSLGPENSYIQLQEENDESINTNVNIDSNSITSPSYAHVLPDCDGGDDDDDHTKKTSAETINAVGVDWNCLGKWLM